jgi:hypothetical protein
MSNPKQAPLLAVACLVGTVAFADRGEAVGDPTRSNAVSPND